MKEKVIIGVLIIVFLAVIKEPLPKSQGSAENNQLIKEQVQIETKIEKKSEKKASIWEASSEELLLEKKLIMDKKSEEEKKIIKICLDPGHQERGNSQKEPNAPNSNVLKAKVSSGTRGSFTGVPEYEFNLDFSKRLKEQLENRGYEVLLTRETHNVDISNKERAEYANDNVVNLFIRIHADGSSNSTVKGFHVLCPSQEREVTKSIYEDSKRASELILEYVKRDKEIPTRGIGFRSDITGFNWSKVPVTLIEVGFMTNKEEERNLLNSEYQLKVIKGICEGIDVYFAN